MSELRTPGEVIVSSADRSHAKTSEWTHLVKFLKRALLRLRHEQKMRTKAIMFSPA